MIDYDWLSNLLSTSSYRIFINYCLLYLYRWLPFRDFNYFPLCCGSYYLNSGLLLLSDLLYAHDGGLFPFEIFRLCFLRLNYYTFSLVFYRNAWISRPIIRFIDKHALILNAFLLYRRFWLHIAHIIDYYTLLWIRFIFLWGPSILLPILTA